MLVLAIDTATSHPALALADGVFEGETELPAGAPSSESLLPAVAGLLARAGLVLGDVGRVVACAGPGSFTGIRVGLATAWGLSRSLGVPLETIGSLEAVAETARTSGDATVHARIEAERGDAYVAEYDVTGPRAREVAPPRTAVAGTPGPAAGFVTARTAASPSPALAAARAVLRSPGAEARVPRALYVRLPAAEERDGVTRS